MPLGATALLIPLLLTAGCANLDSGLLAAAGLDLVQAAVISDEQVKSLSSQAAAHYDEKNRVAPGKSRYFKRLDRLLGKHRTYKGLDLNYKVYMADEMNAFAMADGTIRVYSGLMDRMNDDELFFVIGHEIGHVKLGHTKEKMQVAYTTAAARKGVAAVGGTVGSIARSQVGAFAEAVVNAQFSQREELAADDFGLKFLRRNNYSQKAAVSALRKLGGGSGSFLSSHPDPETRARRLAKKIK